MPKDPTTGRPIRDVAQERLTNLQKPLTTNQKNIATRRSAEALPEGDLGRGTLGTPKKK